MKRAKKSRLVRDRVGGRRIAHKLSNKIKLVYMHGAAILWHIQVIVFSPSRGVEEVLRAIRALFKQCAHPPPLLNFPFPSSPRFQWATPQNELITRLSKVTDTIGTGITRGVNTHIHTHTQEEITLTLKHATFLLERGRWRGKLIKRHLTEERVSLTVCVATCTRIFPPCFCVS